MSKRKHKQNERDSVKNSVDVFSDEIWNAPVTVGTFPPPPEVIDPNYVKLFCCGCNKEQEVKIVDAAFMKQTIRKYYCKVCDRFLNQKFI
jgi:hypothetical protein